MAYASKMCTGLTLKSGNWKIKFNNFFTVFEALELHEKCILILDVLAVTAHKLVYS